MKHIYAMLLALCVVGTCSFDSCLPPPQQSPGFPVDSDYMAVDTEGNVLGGGAVPGQAISGTWLSDDSGAVGSVKYFNVTTDDDGTAFIANGRINANWNSQIIWEPPCGEVTTASGYFMDVTRHWLRMDLHAYDR
jgi:hypothetical protein